MCLRQIDRTTEARGYFPDRNPRPTRSNLPDDKLHPGLIKIFVEAQLDYLEERVYLLAALVKGPEREQVVVRLGQDVPDAESERALLVEWVGAVFAAIGQ